MTMTTIRVEVEMVQILVEVPLQRHDEATTMMHTHTTSMSNPYIPPKSIYAYPNNFEKSKIDSRLRRYDTLAYDLVKYMYILPLYIYLYIYIYVFQ